MAAPSAVALVHATLNEIARVYPRGLLRWIRAHRADLQEIMDDAERRVEEAAQAWRPEQPEEEDALQEALDGLRWAYSEAIAAFHTRDLGLAEKPAEATAAPAYSFSADKELPAF
jgi:hypothetical protein